MQVHLVPSPERPVRKSPNKNTPETTLRTSSPHKTIVTKDTSVSGHFRLMWYVRMEVNNVSRPRLREETLENPATQDKLKKQRLLYIAWKAFICLNSFINVICAFLRLSCASLAGNALPTLGHERLPIRSCLSSLITTAKRLSNLQPLPWGIRSVLKTRTSWQGGYKPHCATKNHTRACRQTSLFKLTAWRGGTPGEGREEEDIETEAVALPPQALRRMTAGA